MPCNRYPKTSVLDDIDNVVAKCEILISKGSNANHDSNALEFIKDLKKGVSEMKESTAKIRKKSRYRW